MTTTEQIAAALIKVGQALCDAEMARVAYNTATDRRLAARREDDAAVMAAEQNMATCKNQWLKERNTYLNLMIKSEK